MVPDALEPGAPIYTVLAAATIVSEMRRGEEFAYYRGMLGHDRYHAQFLDKERYRQINELADFMWKLSADGVGALVQRRMGDEDFMYLFQRGRSK